MKTNSKLKAWLELARISNLPTAWTNVLAGWVLAGGDWDRITDTHRLSSLLAAGSLAYIGGMILNDAFDAGWDREHRKERPVPSGRVSRMATWWSGTICLVASWFLFVWAANTKTEIASGLMLAILLYNWLHKRWAGSVVIMGSCRGLLYLSAGLETGSPWVSPLDLSFSPGYLNCRVVFLWAGAIAITLYIVGLTLVARYESQKGGPAHWIAWISRELLYLPGVLLLILGLGPFFFDRNPLSIIPFVALALFLRFALPMIRKGGEQVGQGVGWLLAGIALVDAMAVSLVFPELALGIAALVPLLRLWQRKIAAT